MGVQGIQVGTAEARAAMSAFTIGKAGFKQTEESIEKNTAQMAEDLGAIREQVVDTGPQSGFGLGFGAVGISP